MKSPRLILLLLALGAALFAVTYWGQREEEPPAVGEPETGAPPAISAPPQDVPPTVVVPQETPPATVVPPKVEAEHAIVSGPLKRSDVLFSPRFYRPDWLDAFRAFSANRIVWTYAGGRLVAEAAAEGIPVQCTIPFWVPKDDPEGNEMACLDPKGAPVSLSPTLVFPDVNSDEWRRYVLSETEKLVDAGCTSFQQDGAWLNYQNSIWRNGCFSQESRAEFRAFVVSSSPSNNPLSRLGDGDTGVSASTDSAKVAFQSFQRRSTDLYHEWLHGSIEAYAEKKTPPVDIGFSGNFAYSLLRDGKSDWLLPDFDFALSEAFGDRDAMPNELRGIARQTNDLVGVSGVTIPSDDVWLNQRTIASAYALGLTAIVPWDVYVQNAPRFFADPADFSPLSRMVRTTPALFDDYVSGADFYGKYGPVLPAQGTVTKVDRTSDPGRTIVSWSRGASFQEVAGGRVVVVGGVKYKTAAPSKVGLIYLGAGAEASVGDPLYLLRGAASYLITVRRNVNDPERQAVHAVSWVEKPVALYLHLRRSDFPKPPMMLVTPKNPTPTPIAPRVAGNYYVYPVGNPIWAILF